MTRHRPWLFLAALALVAWTTGSARAECEAIAFPFAPVNNPSRPWGTTDTGVVTSRFVTLDKAGEPPRFGNRHGVDLSRNNKPDYDMVKACGGEFAFLKADNTFLAHRTELERRGVVTFPYFYFAVPPSLRQARLYNGLNSSKQPEIDSFMARFAALGEAQAADLEIRLAALRMPVIPNVSFVGLSGQIMAIDVEEKISDEGNSSKISRAYFGRFYARSVCSFLAKVREKHPELRPVIYTTPSTFGDYLNYAYPQDDACLHGLPVWLARTTSGGGDLIQNTGSPLDLYAQRLCLQSAGNRCIVHQYSHRALLGKEPPLAEAPHLDVNRFFPVKVVPDGLNQQFVRSGQ